MRHPSLDETDSFGAFTARCDAELWRNLLRRKLFPDFENPSFPNASIGNPGRLELNPD